MKKLLLILGLLFYSFFYSQNCSAFSEGCWNLVSSSNGVELYVTHKFAKIPSSSNLNLIVYSKIVNTNESKVESIAAETPFIEINYYPLAGLAFNPRIPAPSNLNPKQTVLYQEIFTTNFPEIKYVKFAKIAFRLNP
ncbi:hypothetical protein [uncultured Chryseobacterium sp.]|uniref:hypothetical protein n=1 Tax=uncultured Chryseobacterium sp. TaxID=259322 RepID=UPI0025838140|nr:hypothetical protein [uncultured Chryseobacterium sp.]